MLFNPRTNTHTHTYNTPNAIEQMSLQPDWRIVMRTNRCASNICSIYVYYLTFLDRHRSGGGGGVVVGWWRQNHHHRKRACGVRRVREIAQQDPLIYHAHMRAQTQ